jgi:hypothetical protein
VVWRARLNVGCGEGVVPGGAGGVVDMFRRGAEFPVGIRGGWLDMMVRRLEVFAVTGMVSDQSERMLAFCVKVSSRITPGALGGNEDVSSPSGFAKFGPRSL